jgi:hypothetical protein
MILSNGQGGSEKILMDIRCPPITPGNFSKCFLFCGTTLVGPIPPSNMTSNVEGAAVSLGGIGLCQGFVQIVGFLTDDSNFRLMLKVTGKPRNKSETNE